MSKNKKIVKNISPAKKKLNVSENDKFIKLFEYIFIAVLSIYSVLITTSKTWSDDDIFWHLATGRYIVENHVVPSADVFGFVTEGNPWIPFEWGWDVLTFLIYGYSGFLGLSLLLSVIFSCILYIYYYIFKLFKLSTPVIFLFLTIFPLCILGRLTIRPHIISYLFITLLLCIFIRYRYIKRSSIKSLYFIPIIFLIWANFHMGVLSGLLIFAVYITVESLAYKFPYKFSAIEVKPLTQNELKRLLFIFLISIICIFINPYTYTTYIYAYSHTQMKMLEEISEWKSPFDSVFTGDFDMSLYKYYLVISLLIVYFGLKKKDLFPIVLMIVFLVYSLRAVRFTTDYIIVVSIFLFLSLNYLIMKIKSKNIPHFLNKSLVLRLIVLAGIIFLTVNIPNNKLYSDYLNYPRIFGVGIDDDILPLQMFDFIKTNNINQIGQFPFNQIGIGGIFSWYFPDQKDFIDTRNLNDKIYEEYDQIDNKKRGFENKLKEFNIDYVIYYVPNMVVAPLVLNHILVSYLSVNNDEWKLIFWDDKSFLFVKNLPKFQNIISRFEYKYITPYNYIMEKNVINSAFQNDKENVVKEIIRKLKEEPRGVLINNIKKSYQKALKN